MHMNKLIRQYLLFTFGIMVMGWGTCFLFGLWGFYLSNAPWLYIPYLLGGMSPTIASYITLKNHGQVNGFKEWLRCTFDIRHKPLSYLLLPVFAGIFFLCLCCVSGYESGAPFFTIIFMLPIMLFGGGLEEAGWRGILQPEFEKKFGYTVSTILVSLVWWVWHLPLFYIPGVGQYGADFVCFGINVLGLSFALAAIKKVTKSTWLCVLMHCVINSLHGIFIVQENIVGAVVAAAALIGASYVVVWLQKKHQLFA